MFADDTNLTCTGSSANEIEHKLNSDLCNVNRWLRAQTNAEQRKNQIYVDSIKKKIKPNP